MAGLIYVLCAATAVVCSALLWRGFRRNGSQLLFWSCLCFLGLTAESVLLYVDRIIYRNVDLSMSRYLVGFVSLLSLVYALIRESK